MTENKTMIKVRSSDNVEFELETSAAEQSRTIFQLMEDNCAKDVIPLPNVSSEILSRVVDYCKQHDSCKDKKVLDAWDAEFVNVDIKVTLFDLLMASNYLEIKSLLDLTTQRVADIIKGKKPDEIRKAFGIENDFTPEEEVEIQKQNRWAYE